MNESSNTEFELVGFGSQTKENPASLYCGAQRFWILCWTV